MKIKHIFDFNLALSQGRWAWPGGYPLYFICADGEPTSFEAAIEMQAAIRDAIIGGCDRQWEVIAVDTNWEDDEMVCAHTGKKIRSAYGE